MTQSQRVLAALQHGPVNTVDFAQIPVIDGGTPVLRLAARVFDLQRQGHLITTRRRSNGTVDYRLIAGPDFATDGDEPDAVPSPAPSPGGRVGSLFPADEFERRADYKDAA